MRRGARRIPVLVAALGLGASLAGAGAAQAAPVLEVRSTHLPTNFEPGGTGEYRFTVRNNGDQAADPLSEPVTLSVTLPEGLAATEATDPFGGVAWQCTIAPDQRTVDCSYDPVGIFGAITPSREACEGLGGTAFRCPVLVRVDVAPDAESGSATAQACGGDAPSCGSAEEPTTVSPEPAGFGVQRVEAQVLDRDGGPSTTAGAHPWAVSTRVLMNTIHSDNTPDGFSVADTLKTFKLTMPQGFVGDPTATPRRCTRDEFADTSSGIPACPLSSQVGTVDIRAGGVTSSQQAGASFPLPLYNLEPPPGVAAQFGGNFSDTALIIADATVTPEGGYAITVTTKNIAELVHPYEIAFTLWGTPADPSHDPERGICYQNGGTCPVDASPEPFVTNPTSCSGAHDLSVAVEAWHQSPGQFKTSSVDAFPGGLTGCEDLPFRPLISVTPTNPQPDSPSGYEIELRQEEGGLVPSHLKDVKLIMPEGVSISPAGAHGLQACSPAQIALDSPADPACPSASKIGSVQIDTPVLEDPVVGALYLAKQGDNPFRSLFAVYLVASAPGVMIKLPGHVEADPSTGRLVTTFDDNPQLPFERLTLQLKGGPTAPLANPQTCGTHTATADITGWSGASAHPSSSFAIQCPGVAGFAPLFEAGTTEAAGGRFSPFAVRIERPDGQQYIAGVALEMPPGLAAKLKDVPLCPDDQAAAGTCGIESRVGTATVGSGPGSNPFFLQGSVFLTGSYKGAPFGLAVAVPAIAGPFDLGTVVVRQALFVDPVDAHVTVVSDPLPTILEGVPLRLRSVNVDIDRPGFVLNPTSCGEKQIRATLTSTGGTVHRVSQRFQVGDCRALPLKPKLALRLTGRRQTTDGKHPGIEAVLTQGRGQANLKSVAVKLPLSLALDPDHAQSDSLCEFEDGLRVDCPASSVIGRARAVTPLLNRPLAGPVYFVKGVRVDPRTGRRIRTLPTLLVTLRGEVAIDLRAKTSVKRGHLVSTFPAIPDAPVSRFELKLRGGKRGILVVTNDRDVCRGRQVSDVEIDGQNGKRADRAVRMRVPCKAKSK